MLPIILNVFPVENRDISLCLKGWLSGLKAIVSREGFSEHVGHHRYLTEAVVINTNYCNCFFFHFSGRFLEKIYFFSLNVLTLCVFHIVFLSLFFFSESLGSLFLAFLVPDGGCSVAQLHRAGFHSAFGISLSGG